MVSDTICKYGVDLKTRVVRKSCYQFRARPAVSDTDADTVK